MGWGTEVDLGHPAPGSTCSCRSDLPGLTCTLRDGGKAEVSFTATSVDDWPVVAGEHGECRVGVIVFALELAFSSPAESVSPWRRGTELVVPVEVGHAAEVTWPLPGRGWVRRPLRARPVGPPGLADRAVPSLAVRDGGAVAAVTAVGVGTPWTRTRAAAVLSARTWSA